MATLYIIGDLTLVTGTVTPGSSGTWIAECTAAGQAGESAGSSGAGAGYAKRLGIAVTGGTPISFSLGVPGTTSAQAGGDCWVVSAGTVLAAGGGSATAQIGNSTNSGGAAAVAGTTSNAGGGGAGGPAGPGGAGQDGSSLDFTGAGGGASNGGGAGGIGSASAGGDGGGPGGGLGGTTGSVVGGAGTLGGGGGGGWGEFPAGTDGAGGAGGDDYDHGGGGGGGSGWNGDPTAPLGGIGGTPGGGGGSGDATNGIPRGGLSLIRITYVGADPTVALIGGGSYRLLTPNIAGTALRRTQRFRPRRPGRGPIPLIPDSLRDYSPPSGIVQIQASTMIAMRARGAGTARAPVGQRTQLAATGRNAEFGITPAPMTVLTPALVNTTLFEDGQAALAIGPDDVRSLVDTLAGRPTSTSSPRSASYTATLPDYGCCVEFTGGSAQNYTIPTNASVGFAIGTTLWASQMGAGTVTFVAAGGVTLRAHSAAVTAGQYAMIGVRKRATDEWVFVTNV